MCTPEIDLDSLMKKVADACFYEDAGYVYLNPADGCFYNLTPQDDGDFIRSRGFILIWSRTESNVKLTDDWRYACVAAESIIAIEKLVQVAQKALATTV